MGEPGGNLIDREQYRVCIRPGVGVGKIDHRRARGRPHTKRGQLITPGLRRRNA